MNNKTIPVEKIRALIHLWEEIPSDELYQVSAAGVLNELRNLLPPVLPDPLFLAKATHSEYGEGIVGSHHPDEEGEVRFMFPDEETDDGTYFLWVNTSTLTFHTQDMSKNGAEIDTSTEHVDPIDTTPDHPVFLETEEDYENAPEGTIVAADDYWSFARFNSGWITSTRADFDYDEMAGLRRRVLRWGWEA